MGIKILSGEVVPYSLLDCQRISGDLTILGGASYASPYWDHRMLWRSLDN